MSAKQKLLITSWWIFLFLGIILWYRNYNFDRTLSIFLVLLGMIQLLEFAYLNGASASQTGSLIYLIVWLQPVVLWFSLFIFLKQVSGKYSKLCFVMFILYSVFFIYMYFTIGNTVLGLEDNKILWICGEKNFLKGWDPLYWIGIIGPLFIIYLSSGMKNISSVVIFLYMAFTAILSYRYADKYYSTSLWSSLSIGIAFLVWMGGTFPEYINP